MGLEKLFSEDFIAKKVNSFQQRVESVSVEVLSKIGNDLVDYAKASRNYQDITGNLTGSIGYVVFKNGTMVAKGRFTSGTGQSKGIEVAQKLAANSFSESTNLTLAVVAGMQYAVFVEAKGFNVLIPAELKAKTEILTLMKERIKGYLK